VKELLIVYDSTTTRTRRCEELTHSLTLHERQHQPNERTNHNLLLLRPPLLGCEIVLLMCVIRPQSSSKHNIHCQLINHATKLGTQVMVLTPFASSNHWTRQLSILGPRQTPTHHRHPHGGFQPFIMKN